MKWKLYHAARNPYVWIPTTEDDRVIREERSDLPADVAVVSWDIVRGFRTLVPNGGVGSWVWQDLDRDILDPGVALSMIGTQTSPVNKFGETVFVLYDFHKFFESISVIRAVLALKDFLKSNGKMIVFISPSVQIPMELSNDIVVVNYELPDKEKLGRLLESFSEDNELKIEDDDKGALVSAMQGLTREAAENALAFSLVKDKKLFYKSVLDQKAAILKATGVLEYGQFKETFADMHGSEVMRGWCLKTVASGKAKGILIYGAPGCGKSLFAKALANELQRAMLIANFNALRGKYQGDAEGRAEFMFNTIRAFGDSIVFADEFDKSIAGTGSSETDGGVGQRILQKTLTYFEDRPPGGEYWICTANSLTDILNLSGGALVRRFDAIFFTDLPTPKEALGIANIWNRKCNVSIPEDFDFDGWSGADIAKLARTMDMLGCGATEAKRFIIPTKEALGKRLDDIRAAARSVCIWATEGDESQPETMKRRVRL